VSATLTGASDALKPGRLALALPTPIVVATAILAGAAYYGGAQVGFLFTFGSVPTSIFWLPNSTMFAVFLLAPPRTWWFYVVAVVPWHVAVQMQNGVHPLAMLLLFFTNLGDGALGAMLVRAFTAGEPRFNRVRDMVVFLIAAMASPLLVSFLDAAVAVATGWSNAYWLIWYTRVRSNTLTNIILVPTVVVAVSRGRLWWRNSTAPRRAEALALAILLYAVQRLVFGEPGDESIASALVYAPLPLFMWAAVRFGTGGVAVSLVGFAFFVIWNATRGRGPFSVLSPATNTLALQVFLTLLSVPALLLAALLEEQRRIKDALRNRGVLLETRVADRTRALSTLLEIVNTVASTLELEPLLRVVLEQLQIIVRYTGATILIEEDEHLVVLHHRGPLTTEQLSSVRIPAAGAAVHLGRTRDKPFIVDDVWGSGAAAAAFRAGTPPEAMTLFRHARSLLVVPLRARERALGFLWIDDSRPNAYSREDAQLVWALADQAAVAIENARLYHKARDLAAMEERQRLARELHDSVTQTLCAAAMLGQRLPEMWDRDPAQGRVGLVSLQNMTQGALAEMRALLVELRPDALLQFSLGDALSQLAMAQPSRIAAPIEVDVDRSAKFPPGVQIALYRIAQEALSNISKHANASAVHLTLHRERDRTTLTVRDDGAGFDLGAVPPGHLGIGIMRERAAAIGATVRFESAPGHGTTVTVEWTEAAEGQR
jgi:signal transduction histidine kinase